MQCVDYHKLKVVMQALGFDLKKQEVLKFLRDHDTGLMDFQDFAKINDSVNTFFIITWHRASFAGPAPRI